MSAKKTEFIVWLRADGAVADIPALRRLLKALARRYGLRCTSVVEVTHDEEAA